MNTIKLEDYGQSAKVFFGSAKKPLYFMKYKGKDLTYDNVQKFCSKISKQLYENGVRGEIFINTYCPWVSTL